MPRLLSIATVGALSVGAAFGLAPGAAADPPPDQRVSVAVDIVGDSYMAGEGARDTYLDEADPRHRSLVAPALQALSRLETDNSRLRVDANVVAASGARTTDFFSAQKGPDNTVVNSPQRDQLRPGAQIVVVGFGGEDARLATVLADAKRTANGPNTVLDKEIRDLGPLLDSSAPDADYFAQAKSSAPGGAPTLVARLLQVLAGIKVRAPGATIMVTNYPLAADPQNKLAASVVGEGELTSVRKFSYDLNKAIERAVKICGCASLVDVSGAVAGHEAYTSDSAFNEQANQAPRERFQPNLKGASLIADPIAAGIAGLLRITPPKPGDGRMTIPENITIHNGTSDRDGDRIPDARDRAPDDPNHSVDAPKPKPAPHKATAAKPLNHGPLGGVTHVITRTVHIVLPGNGPAKPEPPRAGSDDRNGDKAPDLPKTIPPPGLVLPGQRIDPPTTERTPDKAPSVRDLFTRKSTKRRPAGTAPDPLTPPAVAPKHEEPATPPLSDKRVTGGETAQREPDPADATRTAQGHPRLHRHAVRQPAPAAPAEPEGMTS